MLLLIAKRPITLMCIQYLGLNAPVYCQNTSMVQKYVDDTQKDANAINIGKGMTQYSSMHFFLAFSGASQSIQMWKKYSDGSALQPVVSEDVFLYCQCEKYKVV